MSDRFIVELRHSADAPTHSQSPVSDNKLPRDFHNEDIVAITYTMIDGSTMTYRRIPPDVFTANSAHELTAAMMPDIYEDRPVDRFVDSLKNPHHHE